MSIDPALLAAALADVEDFDLPDGWHQIHTVGINQKSELIVKTFIFETGVEPLPADGGNFQWNGFSNPVNSRGDIDYATVCGRVPDADDECMCGCTAAGDRCDTWYADSQGTASMPSWHKCVRPLVERTML